MLATKRLTRELKLLHDDPPVEFIVKCDENDMLKWYFLIYGSPDTPYEGGLYIGELLFRDTYPFTGPDFIMHTPSGRFDPGKKICTSTSAFHKMEYSSSLNIRTLLMGFLSFMNEDGSGISSLRTSAKDRKTLAAQSVKWTENSNIYKKYFA